MGEVYRARDTKLKRDVALKVLPDVFANDPEQLARFQREAQVLASLNHPNIASIYGLEEADGVRALVLELVEGPTLADLITSRTAQAPAAAATSESARRGAAPSEGVAPRGLEIDEALPIARQMAEALEAAHEAGVIHRDLKPANVKVKADGMVKVLDFGLAKALEGDVGSDPSQSPTMTAAATKMGVIMGTAAYMSPEQAKGKTVDKRADVWAFGAVLYEMLTGQRAFAGDDVSETLATVLKSDPAWQALPAETPPAIKRLLHRCLEKDPRLRLRESGTAIVEIHEAQTTPFAATIEVGATPQPVGWRQAMPWITGAVVGGVIIGLAVWNLRPPEPRSVSRFDYDLPESHPFRNTGQPVIAVSADGSHFVYNTREELFLRSMGELEARLIPGTEESLTSPFFSPDGQWVGYWAATGQLKKMAVSGGAPVILCEATNPFGVSWGLDDTILFGQPAGIMRVSANGGIPELVIATEGEQVHGPQMLPDGESVLFTVTSSTGVSRWDDAQIVVHSLESGERKVLLEGGSDARYLPTGHLVYAFEDGLFALPFDVDNLEVAGGPVSVVQGVQRAPQGVTASANYGVSDRGTLIYVSGSASPLANRTLALVDRNGGVEPLSVPPAVYLSPRLSPDGEKLVVQSDRDGTMSLYWMPADGSGAPERLTTAEDGTSHWLGSWSPDGQTLLFNVEGYRQMLCMTRDQAASFLTPSTKGTPSMTSAIS